MYLSDSLLTDHWPRWMPESLLRSMSCSSLVKLWISARLSVLQLGLQDAPLSLELCLSLLLYELSPSEDAQQVRLLHKVLPYLWKQKLGLLGLQGGQAVSSPNLMHLPLQLLLLHLTMFDVACSPFGSPRFIPPKS